MIQQAFITEGNRANFEAAVIQASRERPVLVDFWAAWCGPCQMLMPLLARLVEEYQGKVALVKVNTDAEQDLAYTYGVRSLPTVKLFRDGEVAGEFVGVQPESVIRTLIERHLPREQDKLAAQADALLEQSRHEEALALLRRALEADDKNDRLKLAFARTVAGMPPAPDAASLYDEAVRALDTLTLDTATGPEAGAIRARVEFARVAAEAPPDEQLSQRIREDGNDVDARYRLAARRVIDGRYEDAMDQLLEVVKRDRAYGEDAGRRGLVGLFGLLGPQDPRVGRYRGKLSTVLN